MENIFSSTLNILKLLIGVDSIHGAIFSYFYLTASQSEQNGLLMKNDWTWQDLIPAGPLSQLLMMMPEYWPRPLLQHPELQKLDSHLVPSLKPGVAVAVPTA